MTTVSTTTRPSLIIRLVVVFVAASAIWALLGWLNDTV